MAPIRNSKTKYGCTVRMLFCKVYKTMGHQNPRGYGIQKAKEGGGVTQNQVIDKTT